MRIKNLIPVLLLSIITGCTKGDKELLDFYLSQPKDSKLIGEWRHMIDPSMIVNYSEDGYIYYYISTKESPRDCWYTEGDSILRRYFYTGGYFYSSVEYPAQQYKIEDDKLYLSDTNIFDSIPNYERNKR